MRPQYITFVKSVTAVKRELFLYADYMYRQLNYEVLFMLDFLQARNYSRSLYSAWHSEALNLDWGLLSACNKT